jgi:hypothetical protein
MLRSTATASRMRVLSLAGMKARLRDVRADGKERGVEAAHLGPRGRLTLG